MLFFVILLSLLVLYFIIHLFSLKKEVKHIGTQLQNYNQQKTNKKIDIALVDRNIEQVAAEINHLIDLHLKEKRERIRFEGELKQLIANMSHDLRTPLTSILGYIQMMETTEMNENERKEFIAIAKSRAKRLESLINDFFELTVIESDDYQLQVERLNIKNLTIDILMSFYDRFNAKDIEPIIHMPKDDLVIDVDKSAFTRVIENLITNAIKYTDGDIMIRLETMDSFAVLTVKNETNSLTQTDVERFFDRFYMADKSRTGNSSGLGLSIVKSMMQKMNGNVIAHLANNQLSIICKWPLEGDSTQS